MSEHIKHDPTTFHTPGFVFIQLGVWSMLLISYSEFDSVYKVLLSLLQMLFNVPVVFSVYSDSILPNCTVI